MRAADRSGFSDRLPGLLLAAGLAASVPAFLPARTQVWPRFSCRATASCHESRSDRSGNSGSTNPTNLAEVPLLLHSFTFLSPPFYSPFTALSIPLLTPIYFPFTSLLRPFYAPFTSLLLPFQPSFHLLKQMLSVSSPLFTFYLAAASCQAAVAGPRGVALSRGLWPLLLPPAPSLARPQLHAVKKSKQASKQALLLLLAACSKACCASPGLLS